MTAAQPAAAGGRTEPLRPGRTRRLSKHSISPGTRRTRTTNAGSSAKRNAVRRARSARSRLERHPVRCPQPGAPAHVCPEGTSKSRPKFAGRIGPISTGTRSTGTGSAGRGSTMATPCTCRVSAQRSTACGRSNSAGHRRDSTRRARHPTQRGRPGLPRWPPLSGARSGRHRNPGWAAVRQRACGRSLAQTLWPAGWHPSASKASGPKRKRPRPSGRGLHFLQQGAREGWIRNPYRPCHPYRPCRPCRACRHRRLASPDARRPWPRW